MKGKKTLFSRIDPTGKKKEKDQIQIQNRQILYTYPKKRVKFLPFWSQTHRNEIRQIQSLQERARRR